MFATTMGLALILSQSTVGWQNPDVVALPLPAPAFVPVQIIEGTPPPPPLVVQLQQSRSWIQRDLAAVALRRVDWRQSPGVVEALSFTVLNDPDFRVRDAAIRTIGWLKPCLPVAHDALNQAAETDRCVLTRLNARHALRKLPPRCEASCSTCEPGSAPTIIPGGVVAEPPTVIQAPRGPATSGPGLPPSLDSSVGPTSSEPSAVPPSAEEIDRTGVLTPLPEAKPGPEDKGPSARRSGSARSRLTMRLQSTLRPKSDR